MFPPLSRPVHWGSSVTRQEHTSPYLNSTTSQWSIKPHRVLPAPQVTVPATETCLRMFTKMWELSSLKKILQPRVNLAAPALDGWFFAVVLWGQLQLCAPWWAVSLYMVLWLCGISVNGKDTVYGYVVWGISVRRCAKFLRTYCNVYVRKVMTIVLECICT